MNTTICKAEHSLQYKNLIHGNFTELSNPKVSKTLKMYLFQNSVCTKPDIDLYFHFSYKKSCKYQITSSVTQLKMLLST